MKPSKWFAGTSIKLIMSQREGCSLLGTGMFSLNFGYSSMSVKSQDKGFRAPVPPEDQPVDKDLGGSISQLKVITRGLM